MMTYVRRIIGTLICLISLYVAFNMANFLIFNPPQFAERKIGDSLDGYWSTENAHGCWEDVYIYIQGDTKYARLGIDNGLVPFSKFEQIKINNGTVEIRHTTSSKGNYQELTLDDQGDRLIFLKVLHRKNGTEKLKEIKKFEGRTYLKRCNVLSINGFGQVAFGLASYKTPDPNELANLKYSNTN